MRIHTLCLCSAYYYDNQSRPVCKAQTNHMNGSDTYLSSYTFTGKKLKECHIHDSQNCRTGIREEKVYTYDGFDRLVSASYGEGLFHFVDGADEEYEYSYDENGNMTKDLNRGIEEIRYNSLNLPSKITFTEKNAYIRNMYDANGHKFKMITYANIPLVIGRAAPAKASAKASTALTCLVYNIFRYVQINKYQPQLIASMG